MCFDLDSEPPIPEATGPRRRTRVVDPLRRRRQSIQGLPCWPAAPTGKAIVILPDVRGLYRYYEELAVRFAEAGVEAIAIDYFGRTAGIGDRDGIVRLGPARSPDDLGRPVGRHRSGRGIPERSGLAGGRHRACPARDIRDRLLHGRPQRLPGRHSATGAGRASLASTAGRADRPATTRRLPPRPWVSSTARSWASSAARTRASRSRSSGLPRRAGGSPCRERDRRGAGCAPQLLRPQTGGVSNSV